MTVKQTQTWEGNNTLSRKTTRTILSASAFIPFPDIITFVIYTFKGRKFVRLFLSTRTNANTFSIEIPYLVPREQRPVPRQGEQGMRWRRPTS